MKVSIVGSLRDREVACSASDRQGSNFEFCVCRTVSSQSSRHPQEVLLAQFSIYVHKGGLQPVSFHFSHIIDWTFSVMLCIVGCSQTPGRIVLTNTRLQCLQSPNFVTEMPNGKYCSGTFLPGQTCSWEIKVL